MKEYDIQEKLLKASKYAIALINEEGYYVDQNKIHENLLKYSIEELKNKTPEVYLGKQFYKIIETIKKDGFFAGEVECTTKEKKRLKCFLIAFPIKINNKTFYIGIKDEISNLKEELLDIILNKSNIGIAIYRDKILYVNSYVEKITGYTANELKNMKVLDLIEDDFKEEIKERIKKRLKGEKFTFSGIIKLKTKDGKGKWIYITTNTILYEGKYAGISTVIDVTQQKQLEEKLYHIQNYDSITDLPNKNLFYEELKTYINEAKRGEKKLAILLLDIYNFTEINESYGRYIGDKLLKQIAKRIQESLFDRDLVARYGSDEFIMAIKDIKNIENLSIILNKLKNSLLKPFNIEGLEIYPNYNIGITIFPTDGKTPDDLIRHAEIALKHAKQKGLNATSFFNKKINESFNKKVEIITQLKKAIQFKEFDVYFQPKVDLKTGKIIGAEALARWKIPPNEFIPILVEVNLMFDAGCAITEKALSYTSQLLKINPDLKIAINMSFEQLKYDTYPQKLWDLAAKYNVPAKNIIIEITETETMKNPDENLRRLNAMKEMDFDISIDDFGTGYSSLKYLKLIPCSEIKIDMSFIRDMLIDKNDEELVKIIINISKIMGVKTVAEGIETKEQLEKLKELGCNYGQGYYFAKPMPFEDFKSFLKQR